MGCVIDFVSIELGFPRGLCWDTVLSRCGWVGDCIFRVRHSWLNSLRNSEIVHLRLLRENASQVCISGYQTIKAIQSISALKRALHSKWPSWLHHSNNPLSNDSCDDMPSSPSTNIRPSTPSLLEIFNVSHHQIDIPTSTQKQVDITTVIRAGLQSRYCDPRTRRSIPRTSLFETWF